MKRYLPIALGIGLLFVNQSQAAEKKSAAKKSNTVPPTSKMIVVPPPSDSGAKGNEPQKLISSEMSGKDLGFFTSVADAGRFQAFLVGLLQSRAESEQIKALGAALAETQDEENKQIAKLGKLKGWTVPAELTAVQKAVGAELEKQKGADFDKAAMDQLVGATKQTVAAYESAAQSSDADIKNFSEHMLPIAHERQALVEKMTGAGKAGKHFLRGGGPPKATPATPAAEAPAVKSVPPPITK